MNQMYHLNPTTNQENRKTVTARDCGGAVFARARAHAPISAPIRAHTREGAKSRSRISLLPLLVAFAVTMIVGVGNAWGQARDTVVNFQTSTTPKNTNIPIGTYKIKVECWGGGGKGQNVSGNNTAAGVGGGGGGYAVGVFKLTNSSTLKAGYQLDVTVGVGSTTSGSRGGFSNVKYGTEMTLAQGEGGSSASNYTSSGSSTSNASGGGGSVDSSADSSDTKTGGRGFTANGNSRGGGGGGAAGPGNAGEGYIQNNQSQQNGGTGHAGIMIGTTIYNGSGGKGSYANNDNANSNPAGAGGNFGGGGGGGSRDYSGGLFGWGSHNYYRESGNGADGYVRVTYTILTLNVTLKPNGGNGSDKTFPMLYLTQFTADTLVNPFTRDGYTFAGWNTQADGNGTTVAAGDECEFTADQTLYAQWTPREYTITFDASRPTGVTENVTWNTTCFSGYNTTLSTDNTRVFVRNYSDNEHVYGNECVEHADAVTLDGYVITGWYAAPTGGTPVSYNDAITAGTGAGNIDFPADETQRGSITFYAHWREAYYCFLHADGGVMDAACVTSCGLSTTTDGYSFEIPETGAMNSGLAGDCGTAAKMTREGYTFGGWYTGVGGTGTLVDFSQSNASTGSMQVYAKWTPKEHTLTFNANSGKFDGGSATTKETHIIYDSAYNTAKYNNVKGWETFGVARTGYNFVGWYSTTEEAATANPEAKIKGSDLFKYDGDDKVVYAGWSPIDYELSFHADVNSTTTASFPGDAGSVTADITFDSLYNTARVAGVKGWNNQFGLLKTGYTFNGWWKTGAADSVNGAQAHYITPGSDDLYAHWTANNYTCTLDVNGGTLTPGCAAISNNKFTVTYDSPINSAISGCSLTAMTRTGYTFDDWYEKDGSSTGIWGVKANFNNDYSRDGDTTFYAKWNPKKVTVIFEGNGGLPETQSDEYTYDAQYVTLPTVTKPGYSFSWYNGTTQITTDSKCNQTNISWPADETQPGTLTLTAQWSPKQYQLTLKSNGGAFNTSPTSSHTVYITYDQPYNSLSGWEQLGLGNRTGYTFAGWYTDATDGERRLGNRTFTGDDTLSTTLYAHWTPKTYTCTVEDYTQGDDDHQATVNCSALVNSTFIATFGQTFNASLGCDLNTDIYCKGFTKRWQRKTGNNWWNWEYFDPATTIWEWESNQTIRAVWEKDEDLEVTVYLDPNNGVVNRQSYTLKYWYGNSLKTNRYGIYNCNVLGCNNTNFLTQNVSISRTGYTFDGWWYNEERITNDTPLRSAETHTLTASWIANDYTVTVHANGGTLPNSCTSCMTTPTTFKVKFDQPMNYYFSECTGCNINDVTREGYTFGGWYMNESCTGDALDFTGTWQAAYNAHIYAKWIPNEYTVTLHSNGGHFNTEDTVFTATFDQAYGNYLNSTAVQKPERDGWTFRGWYHENNATAANTEVFSGTPCTTAEDHTLYARWEKNITASVTMDSVSCYGYGNGVVKIDDIVGGEGDYYVTIKKGDTVFTQIVSHPAEGTASVNFDGAAAGVDWHDSITTGNWDVYIYDASHYSTYQCEIPSYVQNPHRDDCDSTYAGTGFDVCRLPVFRIKVEEPEPLAFTATASPQTCYNQGSVLVNVSGANGQYTVSWEGSTGISSQSGSREVAGQYGTGWSASTNITGLLAQEVTLHVTDQKGCPVADQTVTIGQPTESVPAIDNVEKTVCSGQEFILPENRPVGVRYSWSTPAGTGCSGGESGDMMPSVNGTLTNTTNQEQVYTYQVTPSMGVHCTGTPFTVTVTVGPNRTEAPTTVEVTSPAQGCARAERTLLAEFSGAVSNVTYQIDGGYGNGSMTAATNPDNTYNAIIQLPDTCRGDIGFTVTAKDAYGCDVTGEGTLKVRIAPWSIEASTYGTGEVTCLAEAVEPTTHVPSNITDGCGNALTGELTATEYSTDNGAHWTASPFTCAGQVRYTYTFTACDNTSAVWTYTYTVTGMAADSVVVNEPLTSVDADVDATRCIFQVPNLKDAFLSRIAAASTCTAPSEVGFQQTPQAGSFISANTEVSVTLTDGCNRVSRYKVTVTVPTRPTLQQPITHGYILCHGGTTSATVAVTHGTGTPGYTYRWSNNSEEATAENLTAGSYTVTVTDANGCMAYGFVTLTEPTEILFDIVLSDDTICYGDNVVVSANVSGGTYPYVYHWNQGIVGPVSPIQTLTESTEYTLQIEDANHCMTAVKKDTVIVNALPQVAITPADTHICAGGTATLTAVTADAVTYSWGSSDTYTVKPDSVAGVYPYSVTVTQTGGQHCVNTATVNVTVHTLPTTTIMNHPAAIAVNDSAVIGVRPLEDGESVTWIIERNVENSGGNASIL
ncbi:MAG: InlB B-repeat-containing protein, partial [Bacteroidales bacterium]|nr:InlB B-repeat-containing protein [Bacteroidales bacterium]